MSTKIPKYGLIVTFLALAFAAATFTFLNQSFGGPTLLPSNAYELTADFDDTTQIVKKSLVMTRGVQVGEVLSIDVLDDGRGRVRFAIDDEHAPVFTDATARLGTRTIFGEAFLDLDPGTEAAGDLAGGSAVTGLPTVEADEALKTLDEPTRERLSSATRTLARGYRDGEAATRVNETVGGLAATTGELRELVDALRDQEDDLATIVGSGNVAVGAIGQKEAALRRIVGSGRMTLEAVADQRSSLEQGLDELEPLLARAEGTLGRVRPLLVEARPLVDDLSQAAPDLTPVLRDTRPIARDLSQLADRAGPVTDAAVPALNTATPILRKLSPVAEELLPATQNLVPLARYLSPRARDVAGLFANAGAATDQGDSSGKWVRFFLFQDRDQTFGRKVEDGCAPGAEPKADGSACFNAYPEPRDAADPKPYEPGSYPRLKPFVVGGR